MRRETYSGIFGPYDIRPPALQFGSHLGSVALTGKGNTVKSTGARSEKPSWPAPAGVKSITRPRVKGPRSLIRTVIKRPLFLLVT